MQEQKKYHHRKLAIIEMIEECDRCIDNANSFIRLIRVSNERVRNGLIANSKENIERYERIKQRLTEWLCESNNRN